MRKGRPKGEHKTMISARVTDENIRYLNRIYNIYNINKSDFINKAIKNYYREFIEKYKQSNFNNSLRMYFYKEEETN